LTILTFPVAAAVTGVLVLVGDAPLWVLLLAAALGFLGPQMAALVLTFPVGWFAALQTWFRGSRDARLRFGLTDFVYPYYGWRYAFCDRSRQWGALSHEEQVAKDPHRAGVHTDPPPRRNYWPG
jgi:hypothetical protein